MTPARADDAEAFRIERRLRQARVLPGQLGRRGGELNIARHHLDALPRLDQLLRIEVGDLAAERRDPTGGGQMRQRAHAALPRLDRVPHRLAPDTNRRDDAHPGDDNFSLSHFASRPARGC